MESLFSTASILSPFTAESGGQSHETSNLSALERIDLLTKQRETLLQFIAKALADLQAVSVSLEAAHAAARKEAVEKALAEVRKKPEIPELTEQQKRFLALKSYSFPYLSEESWYNHYPLTVDENVEVNGIGDSDKGSEDSEFDLSFVRDGEGKFMWTNFLQAQETSLGGEDEQL